MSPSQKPMTTRRRERVAGFSQPAESQNPPPATPAAARGGIELDGSTTPDKPEAAGATVQEPVEIAPKPRRARRAAESRAGTNGAADADGGEPLRKPGGYRHQTNFRLFESEVAFLKQQQRALEDDDGIKTDTTELVHALIYAARRGELEPIEILRRWRTDLHAI